MTASRTVTSTLGELHILSTLLSRLLLAFTSETSSVAGTFLVVFLVALAVGIRFTAVEAAALLFGDAATAACIYTTGTHTSFVA